MMNQARTSSCRGHTRSVHIPPLLHLIPSTCPHHSLVPHILLPPLLFPLHLITTINTPLPPLTVITTTPHFLILPLLHLMLMLFSGWGSGEQAAGDHKSKLQEMTNSHQPPFFLSTKPSTSSTHYLCWSTNPLHTQPIKWLLHWSVLSHLLQLSLAHTLLICHISRQNLPATGKEESVWHITVYTC